MFEMPQRRRNSSAAGPEADNRESHNPSWEVAVDTADPLLANTRRRRTAPRAADSPSRLAPCRFSGPAGHRALPPFELRSTRRLLPSPWFLRLFGHMPRIPGISSFARYLEVRGIFASPLRNVPPQNLMIGKDFTMEIPKDAILELLNGRGDDANVQQAQAELPDNVDTDRDQGLLAKFGINPADLIGGLGAKFGL
jgi:hypothetical protein